MRTIFTTILGRDLFIEADLSSPWRLSLERLERDRRLELGCMTVLMEL